MAEEGASTSSVGLQPVNPRPFLASLVGKPIIVKLKWGMEYRGILECADAYMNLQILQAEEFVEGSKICVLDELLIRCNNILFVRPNAVEPETATDTDADK